ncbi:MAG: FAD-binding oxidoreductase, partial [Proteobacteria bacterium]|nr:FAD-binding oxidoreductase [Pseudomonadota bacterium]
VAAILRAANRTGTPVRPRGGGTGWWSSTRPPGGGILLQLTRMNEVLAIDEDVMTVRAEAGVTFARLEDALAAKGYRIMIFPESGRTATLGGHIQTWGTSPHTSSVFEDQATQIVGLKAVLPTGEIVPTGTGAVTTASGDFSRRFFPADLTGLFLGSEGAFGVIAEATLKIHRQPEASLTRVAGFPDITTAIAALRAFQQVQRGGGLSTLIEQRLAPREMLLATIPRLRESFPEAVKFLLVLRVEGDLADVQGHMARACALSRDQEGQVIEDDLPEWWAGRFGSFPAAGLGKGPRIMLVAMVPFGRMAEACAIVEAFGEKHGLSLKLRGYPFGAPVFLAHASISWEAARPESRDEALARARELMEALIGIGAVPHRVGSDFLPVLVEKLDPAYYGFVKRMKKMLDPQGIMNPGVIVSG